MRTVLFGTVGFLLFSANAWAPEEDTIPAWRLEAPLTTAPSVSPLSQFRPETSLIGSTESLVWQNLKLTLEGAERFQNDWQLKEAIDSGTLVPLSFGECLVADGRLDGKWHFVLERVNRLLSVFGRTICTEFGRPAKVNSAVRHIPRQLELIRIGNLNAVPVSGPRASPHLTGASVDIAVLGMPRGFLELASEILLGLEDAGLIDATLETKANTVLHVTVFQEYK